MSERYLLLCSEFCCRKGILVRQVKSVEIWGRKKRYSSLELAFLVPKALRGHTTPVNGDCEISKAQSTCWV